MISNQTCGFIDYKVQPLSVTWKSKKKEKRKEKKGKNKTPTTR
jgi:hypothetical protein